MRGRIDPAAAQFRARSTAASCLLCSGVGWINYFSLDEPLFAALQLTGRLLELLLAGSVLYLAAAAVALTSRRIGGVLGVVASILVAPVYLYVLNPGLFDPLSTGPRAALPGSSYLLGEWALLGMVTIAVMAFAFLRPPRRGRPRYRR